MAGNCHICGHGETFHDRWSICSIRECGPCFTELECPRCKHTFFDHSIWIDRTKVMCVHPGCKLLVCYDIKHPERATSMMSQAEWDNVVPLVPRRTEPVYEEPLVQHPLELSPHRITSATPLAVVPVDDDPLVAPGVWKQYRPGRSYDTTKQGYTEIDYEEKHPSGAYKHHQPGRTWETKLGGYVDDTPPGPPERGFID